MTSVAAASVARLSAVAVPARLGGAMLASTVTLVLASTTTSGLPSRLTSARTNDLIDGAGLKSVLAWKVPLPLPSNTEIMPVP